MKKVVFMGTPDFAVGTLSALIDSEDYEVSAVFSQPDRPRGRNRTPEATPVKATAEKAGIPVYQPQKIREEKWVEILRSLKPDFIVVTAFGQIIPMSILEVPSYCCVNVHASLLPKYRGAAPIQWAVIDGEKESGVTTMRMDAGLDTGDMILKETVPLAADETAGSLSEKLSSAGAALLIRTLDLIVSGEAVYEKQPEKSPNAYARTLTKEDGKVDWSRPAPELERRIRGLNPWPCAYTSLNGRNLKIWNARAVLEDGTDSDQSVKETAPGTVLRVTKHNFYVQTGDGMLSLLEVQPEGKKRMQADAFLRGYSVREGEIFT